MLWLVSCPARIVTSGTLTGQALQFLRQCAVVGRGQFSDIRLNDTTVSRRHALIRAIGERYELSDQDSVNGTRLRGERLTAPTTIKDGDEIEFGEIKTMFRSARDDRPSAPSA